MTHLGAANLLDDVQHMKATANLLGSDANYATQQQATGQLLGSSSSAPAIGVSYVAQQQATSNLLGGTVPAPAFAASGGYTAQQQATANLLQGAASTPAVGSSYAAQQQTTAQLLNTAPMGAGGYAAQQDATKRLLGDVPEGQFELHFIGELEVGSKFSGVAFNEGLFVDYQVHSGEQWTPIAKPVEGYAGQTQTAYADAEGMFVFNHPLDLFYITNSLAEWPRLHLQVLRLDSAGRSETVSYGAVSLPMVPGHVDLNCRTWTPLGDSAWAEAQAAHTGERAELQARTEVLDGKLPKVRTQLVTKASGTVHISFDVVFRNAEEQGILLPGRSRAPQMSTLMPETWR